MNKLAALCLFFGLTVATSLAGFQGEISYIYAGTDIIGVSDNEIVETLPLPEAAQNLEFSLSFDGMGLSPDLTYFVFAQDQAVGTSDTGTSLQIANLAEGTCCTTVPNPFEAPSETITIGAFNPDTTQVVVNYNLAYFNEFEALTAIVDLQTGEFVKLVDTQAVFDVPLLQVIDWTEDGVVYLPVGCFPCGAGPSGNAMLWNPDTSEITTFDATWPSFGSRLESTGEIIIAQRDDTLPVSNADAMFDPSNVIVMTDDDESETTIIYHHPDHLHLGAPQWVLNGEAYMTPLLDSQQTLVISRDGTVWDVPTSQSQTFLTGTKSGWLSFDEVSRTLYAYILTDGAWVTTDLGTYSDSVVRLLLAPEIGADVEPDMQVIFKRE